MTSSQATLDLFSIDLPVSLTVGVDEVGRGPLVGDVVTAAVILPDDFTPAVKDSKKLSEAQRRLLSDQIKAEALDYCIAFASPEEIDELNILHATMLAMKRAVEGLKCPFEKVYVDGNRCPQIPYECEAVVKGDDKLACISAASILAKVYRDEQMEKLHQQYPDYGFDQHKGYPTKLHLEKIQQLGVFEGYRKSFKPVKQLLDSSN